MHRSPPTHRSPSLRAPPASILARGLISQPSSKDRGAGPVSRSHASSHDGDDRESTSPQTSPGSGIASPQWEKMRPCQSASAGCASDRLERYTVRCVSLIHSASSRHSDGPIPPGRVSSALQPGKPRAAHLRPAGRLSTRQRERAACSRGSRSLWRRSSALSPSGCPSVHTTLSKWRSRLTVAAPSAASVCERERCEQTASEAPASESAESAASSMATRLVPPKQRASAWASSSPRNPRLARESSSSKTISGVGKCTVTSLMGEAAPEPPASASRITRLTDGARTRLTSNEHSSAECGCQIAGSGADANREAAGTRCPRPSAKAAARKLPVSLYRRAASSSSSSSSGELISALNLWQYARSELLESGRERRGSSRFKELDRKKQAPSPPPPFPPAGSTSCWGLWVVWGLAFPLPVAVQCWCVGLRPEYLSQVQ
eukprot:scaffold32520_cov108-Isochrysis_galbana.AAC.6